MRRRPQRLQVSTFPFLAVLLCAMGSLILLLLVIDRRGKIVARHKAMQAAQEAMADKVRRAKHDDEEWQRQRQAVHERLRRDHDALKLEVESAQAEALGAQRKGHEGLAMLQMYERKLETARALLEQERVALAQIPSPAPVA